MKEQILQFIIPHSPEYAIWLKEKEGNIKEQFTFRDFYLTFSMASRIKGGAILLSGELETAGHEKMKINDWEISRLGRVYLLICLSAYVPEKVEKAYNQLFETAELKELIALYSTLPFMPDPEKYVERAAEGVRTNIGPVFEAIALANPYPSRNLPETLWNQMVLKAVFTDKPLYAIIGIDDRANPKLALMLINFAKERWAAGRFVTPELWRPVGAFLTADDMEYLKTLLHDPETFQREAAILACSESSDAKVREIVNQHPDIKERIESKSLTWESLGRAYWKNKTQN